MKNARSIKDAPLLVGHETGSYVPTLVVSPMDRPHEAVTAGVVQAHRTAESRSRLALAFLPLVAIPRSETLEGIAKSVRAKAVSQLARRHDLRVIPHGSVCRYTACGKPMKQVAQGVGAQIVVCGLVGSGDAGLNITLELYDANGDNLSTERFEDSHDDWATFAPRVVAAVVHRLGECGAEGRFANCERLFATMYRASRLCDTFDERGLSSARSLLKEVVRQAPAYPGAQAAIAHCYIDLFRRGCISHADASTGSCDAVRAAVACDRRLGADTLCAMGAVACYIDWNLVLAEQRFRAALALRPSARRAELLAELLTMTGRFDEASFYLNIARQLDSFTVRHHFATLACAFYRREDPCKYTSIAGTDETVALQWEAATQGAMRDSMGQAAQHAAKAEVTAALGCLAEAVASREPLFLFQQVDRRFDGLRDTPQFRALDRVVKWGV